MQSFRSRDGGSLDKQRGVFHITSTFCLFAVGKSMDNASVSPNATIVF